MKSVIALDTLKLSNNSKILSKFYAKQFILSIGYRKKNSKSNLNLIATFTPNLTASFSTLLFFFADFPFVSIVRDKIAKSTQVFITASTYDIMRY